MFFSFLGLYGDIINELSWAVGEIVDTVKRSVHANNTLILVISDNGPGLELCNGGGSSGGLKGTIHVHTGLYILTFLCRLSAGLIYTFAYFVLGKCF